MAVHWFAFLCFSIAALLLIIGFICVITDELSVGTVLLGICIVAAFVGCCVIGYANKQNEGLAGRNTKEFKARGYKVISAYGHKVCVAAGTYPICMQERKDATGKKQLVIKQTNDQWVVVDQSFFAAIAQAPHQ